MSATDSQRAVRTGLPLLRGPSQGPPFDFDGDAEKKPEIPTCERIWRKTWETGSKSNSFSPFFLLINPTI